ncbi:unnamed protein product [Bursaphelenchus xylophilus]|uniref:(pine wood nematode) hypothetical protein n=1 Tax=Bursaphelenchus xylophilus TaxID=6326 RepID=A0A1I7S4J7_BURXY|nr:unnamed protein product [Bursaphelenchus xylophilus]CAG9117174.1 unnamed protein product [Bursaphelenchus xylophilus]
MVVKRYEPVEPVDNDFRILGDELKFKTSGKVAKNRFLKSALSESLATWDAGDLTASGIPTERLINMYDKWGHGDFGVVMTGNLQVNPTHLESAGNMFICKESWTEEKTRKFRHLANVIKHDKTLAIAQISHAGRQTPITLNKHPFSASDVHLKFKAHNYVDNLSIVTEYAKPTPYSLEQIQSEVIHRFVFTAEKLYECGFDGVQLHGAHGYLLAQFLAPDTNLRTDKYGGSGEKRAQILVDIYNAIRLKIPASTGFIVGVKMNSVEFQANGLGVEDAITTAKILDNIGMDFIEFSGGNYEDFVWTINDPTLKKESTLKREAFFVQFVKAIKPHIKQAIVYITGGFRTSSAMVQTVKSGVAEGIGLGRPAAAEPDLPLKLISGNVTGAEFSPYQVGENFFICMTQMVQAGERAFSECNGDVCRDIMDHSNEEEMNYFFPELWKFYKDRMHAFLNGIPVKGCCLYKPKFGNNEG